MYVDCRFGQLHVHTAFPSSGGFDELTPVVCVHPTTATGRVFRGLLADLGLDRSAYAPDLPGSGESDVEEGSVSIADQAAALADLVDTLRLRRVDVIGCQTGSLVAAELALIRPDHVRKVVFVGVPGTDQGNYASGERLPLLKQPVLVLRPHDEFWESTARIDGLVKDLRRVDMPDRDGKAVESAAADVARYVREFLDR
jgi:pimeloyl-ACP methyl ester carboxylesterase